MQGCWGTPDMVEGGMGTCWSGIRVTNLKFEELQPSHKGILVSDK